MNVVHQTAPTLLVKVKSHQQTHSQQTHTDLNEDAGIVSIEPLLQEPRADCSPKQLHRDQQNSGRPQLLQEERVDEPRSQRDYARVDCGGDQRKGDRSAVLHQIFDPSSVAEEAEGKHCEAEEDHRKPKDRQQRIDSFVEDGRREEQFEFEQSVKGELFHVPLEEHQQNDSHEAILPQRQRNSEPWQQFEEAEAE